jgi:hypothetical protein
MKPTDNTTTDTSNGTSTPAPLTAPASAPSRAWIVLAVVAVALVLLAVFKQ